jgi:hypothetical protein
MTVHHLALLSHITMECCIRPWDASGHFAAQVKFEEYDACRQLHLRKMPAVPSFWELVLI